MRLFQYLIYIFIPNVCVYCKKIIPPDEINLCQKCWNSIKIINGKICQTCGIPLPFGGANCYICRKNKHNFDLLRSATIYDGVIKECIHMFKYQSKDFLVKIFSSLLYNGLFRYRELKDADFILSVPLHWLKKFKRGYNQAELIAREFSKLSGIPYLNDVIFRKRYTKPQIYLSGEDRRKNVEGVFEVKNENKIAGKKLILIDDVCTTGSTLDECSKVLKKAGAESVYCYTVAREC